MAGICPGTVYGKLQRLGECGVIHKVQPAGTERGFDGKAGNHDHLRCICCGRAEDLAVEATAQLEMACGRAATTK